MFAVGLSHSINPPGVMMQMVQTLRLCYAVGDDSCFYWWAWW
jgi:hypothetical protein